jgi:hypothetical protein
MSTNLKNRFDNRLGSMAVPNNRPTLMRVLLFSLTCAVASDLSFCEGGGLENIIFIDVQEARGHLLRSSQRLQQLCSQQTQHCCCNCFISLLGFFKLTFCWPRSIWKTRIWQSKSYCRQRLKSWFQVGKTQSHWS